MLHRPRCLSKLALNLALVPPPLSLVEAESTPFALALGTVSFVPSRS